MDKPKNYDNTEPTATESAEFNNLLDALRSIDPDNMKADGDATISQPMTVDEALTLRAACKVEGIDREEFAKVMQKSALDRGTFYLEKNWNKVTGMNVYTGRVASYKSIYKFAYRSGWKGKTINRTNKAPAKPTINNCIIECTPEEMKQLAFECYVDPVQYSQKPKRYTEIRSREPEGYTQQIYTLPEFIKAVTHGQSFRPAVTRIKTTQVINQKGEPETQRNYDFIEQQLFAVDIDNTTYEKDKKGNIIKDENGKPIKISIQNPLTVEKALHICEVNKVKPCFIYETFSSKKHRYDRKDPYTKFRMIFLLNEPIRTSDPEALTLRSEFSKYLVDLFGEGSDTGITDIPRIISGTDETSGRYVRAYSFLVDKKEIIKRMQSLRPKEEDKKEEDKKKDEPTLIVDNIQSYAEQFKINREKYDNSIKSGFLPLDKILNGGFIDELYVVAAHTGTGKSAFTSCICQNIAQSGVNVLYFAIEMSKDEFIARGSSSISFEHNRLMPSNAIKYCHILNDKYDDTTQTFTRLKYDNYAKYVNEYMQRFGQHLYIIECGITSVTAKNICDTVIKFKEGHPDEQLFVVIDYLQILTGEDGETNSLNITSNAIRQFKALASQKHCSVFVISSVPKSENRARISENSFKGNNDIAFTGGVLIGWDWTDLQESAGEIPGDDTRNKKKQEVNHRGYRNQTVTILKNRSGSVGDECKMYYYPAYNYITDQEPGKTEIKIRRKEDASHFLNLVLQATANNFDIVRQTKPDSRQIKIEDIARTVAKVQNVNADLDRLGNHTREFNKLFDNIKKTLQAEQIGTIKNSVLTVKEDFDSDAIIGFTSPINGTPFNN